MPTLIFDGDCGICHTSVAWTRKHLRAGETVEFVPWQSVPNLAALGLTEEQTSSAAWWVDASGAAPAGGHLAIAAALGRCRRPWPAVGRALAVWPVSVAAARGYRWVADNRHRLSRFTGGPACPVPDEEPLTRR